MQRQAEGKKAAKYALQYQYCRSAQCSSVVSETRTAIAGATEVHRALCAPEWQRVGGYEIASRIVPARQVGGGFVYSSQQRDKTFLVLGDLMGKGLSAAMWITHVIDLVHRAAEGALNVCDLLTRLNLEIVHSRVRAPLTSAMALSIDQSNGALSCASAGHPPALILRRDATIQAAAAGGPLLGVLSSARYERQDIYLKSGESIIAFSDGLTEGTGNSRQEFTIETVMAPVMQNASSPATAKISKLLGASVAQHGNPLDDVSILVLQRS